MFVCSSICNDIFIMWANEELSFDQALEDRDRIYDYIRILF